jgi:hypothetical protein
VPAGFSLLTKTSPKLPAAPVRLNAPGVVLKSGDCVVHGLTLAVAHEGMKMECNEAGMNAMHADIQSMNDGKAKTTAMKEMKMAEEMMAKKDMKACATHMHNAMEATER